MNEHECCRCALRLRVFIEKDGLPAVIRGAVKGVMSDKKHDLQGVEISSITKRLVGQIRAELLAALNGRPPMRHRFDPYKRHCRTCSCGAEALRGLQKLGIREPEEQK